MQNHRATWTLVLAAFGAFLTALDVVVVTMALPTIQTQFDASLAELDWIVNAYALSFAALLLIGAALGDRFGRRRMYVVGIVIFTLASVLAALSTNAGMLITARLVQGVGAAVLAPLSLTLIVVAFPPAKLSGAIGIWAGIMGLGVAIGPVVGGAVVQGFAWEAIFWLNVPIGAVVAVLCMMFLTESHGGAQRLDIVGVVLAGLGLLGLAWAPVRAPDAGWGSLEVIGSLAGGAVLMVLFVLWERRSDHAMLPVAYFKIRGFVVANTVSFLQNVSLIGAVFMITQLIQIGLGHDPLSAGARMLPLSLTPLVVSPIAGMLAGRLGDRPFLILSMALHTIGLVWLAIVVQAGVDYVYLVPPFIVAGVGLSMGFPSIAAMVTGSVPPEGQGIASGTQRALAQAGGLFGVAIVSAVFASAGGYGSAQSFIDGFTKAMWVAALVPALGLLVALFAPRPAQVAAQAVTPQAEPVRKEAVSPQAKQTT
ncbi:MFS transporter [Phytohabitans rumicis]|uniref:MFS transporter n=1 Tax=Phytohabitans rumicis TaxID=1076125 RepID=A0A6V8LJX0_9ACTN|nr:MFS transporter [Phytohabitans rumicis]GFJ96514.1 MFS transporter [Phytohabitans rumicis]